MSPERAVMAVGTVAGVVTQRPSRWIEPVAAGMLEALYGPAVRGWLAGLDELVGEVCAQWRLQPLGRLPGAGASAVLQVWAHDTQQLAVLKLAPAAAKLHEAALACTAWQATAVRYRVPVPFPEVQGVAPERAAMLLEWVPAAGPGRFGAAPGRDELACIGGMLHLAAKTSGAALGRVELDGMQRRARDLEVMAGMCELSDGEAEQVALAAHTHARACEALGTVQGEQLVHADLWPPNVLVSPRRWAVIDPWPCQGEAAMDLGQWAATTNDGWGAEARCGALAEFAGCSPERAWAWTAERAALRMLLILSHGLEPHSLTGLAGVCTRWLAAPDQPVGP